MITVVFLKIFFANMADFFTSLWFELFVVTGIIFFASMLIIFISWSFKDSLNIFMQSPPLFTSVVDNRVTWRTFQRQG